MYSLVDCTVTPCRHGDGSGGKKNQQEREGEGGEEEDQEEGDESEEEREKEMIGRRKRRHLRSRNPYIDRHLKDMTGDDDFADLEDFIVT